MISAEIIAGLDDVMIKQISDSLKQSKGEEIAKAGGHLDDLTVVKDTLAGFPCLVTTIKQTPAQGAIAQVYTQTWEIPAGKSYYTIAFIWPKLIEGTAKPKLDALRAAIKLSPAH